MSLCNISDEYELFAHLDLNLRGGLKTRSYVDYRRRYSDSSHYKKEPDLDGFGYNQILVVRGQWLIQNKPQIASEWVKNRSLIFLSKLAKKYLPDDYKISPRIARKIVYSALQRMLGDESLEGINPDDNFYYKTPYNFSSQSGRSKRIKPSKNGKKRK